MTGLTGLKQVKSTTYCNSECKMAKYKLSVLTECNHIINVLLNGFGDNTAVHVTNFSQFPSPFEGFKKYLPALSPNPFNKIY